MPNAPSAAEARQWAMEVRRFQRQEQAQGHVSPTDAAFLTRLASFLDERVAGALECHGAPEEAEDPCNGRTTI